MNIKEQYKKERKRVSNLINRYKKKFGNVELKLPKIPKRITKGSIRALSKINADYVRRKTYVPDLETGERIKLSKVYNKGKKYSRDYIKKYKEYIKIINEILVEKDISSSIPYELTDITLNLTPLETNSEQLEYVKFSDVVIENFREYISDFNDIAKDIFTDWVDTCISLYGEDKTAEMLEDGKQQGYWPSTKDAYKKNAIEQSIYAMSNLLDLSAGEKAQLIAEGFEIFDEMD